MSHLWFSVTRRARVFKYGDFSKTTRDAKFLDNFLLDSGATKRRIQNSDSEYDGSSCNGSDDDSKSNEYEPLHNTRLDLWGERSDDNDGFNWLHRLLKHIRETSKK